MSYLYASNPRHAAIRAEMRDLSIRGRSPVPALLFALVAAATTASAVLSLSGL